MNVAVDLYNRYTSDKTLECYKKALEIEPENSNLKDLIDSIN